MLYDALEEAGWPLRWYQIYPGETYADDLPTYVYSLPGKHKLRLLVIYEHYWEDMDMEWEWEIIGQEFTHVPLGFHDMDFYVPSLEQAKSYSEKFLKFCLMNDIHTYIRLEQLPT